MPPVFSNIMAPPPPSGIPDLTLSEISLHSGRDSTTGHRPFHNNRPNAANVERVARWLTQHALDGTFLVIDRQDPRSTSEDHDEDVIMTGGDSFIDRGAVVEPEYIFSRPGAQKRKISRHGHRDQDPGTPEPSREAMRADMKALLAGGYSMPASTRKRVKMSPRPPQHSALHLLRPQAPVIELDDEVANPTSAVAPAPAPLPPPWGNFAVAPTAAPPPLLPLPTRLSSALAPTAPLPPSAPARGGPPPIVAYRQRPTPVTTPAPTPAPSSGGPASIVVYKQRPTLEATPAPTPTSSFGDFQTHASTSARAPGPEPIFVLRRPRLQVPAPSAFVTPAHDLRIITEQPPSVASSAFSSPTTIPESPRDNIESPVSPELPLTPKRRGRKPKQPRAAPRPKPQPKPTVDSGATLETANDADGEIKECAFFNIPQEIRNHIYRHLLVSRNPIQVKQLWTEPARNKAPRRMPRRRGAAPERLFNEETDMGIDTRILYVSKQAHLEGSRILYSENRFHYILRDAGMKSLRRPTGQINFEKYCHLFRHLSIELEPNRTDKLHEKLLGWSLECLAGADGSSSSWSSRANPVASPISLDTLTLTITPVKEAGRSRRNGLPAVIGFFARNSAALKSLQRINTRSIRFNVHVERPREDEDSDDEPDDDDVDMDGGGLVRTEGTDNFRHLEATIDLRFCVRFMDQSAMRHIENPYYDGSSAGDSSVPKLIKVYPDEFWKVDAHILAKRAMLGQRAEAALADLYNRLVEAWKNPDQAVRDGLWEDHEHAEQRRRINRAKHQIRFDCDALLFQKKKKKRKPKTTRKGKEVAGRDDWRFESDETSGASDDETETDEDTDSEGDDSDADSEPPAGGYQLVRTPAKSLIISIAKHGGAFRAFRAN